jgi:inosine/guanosine/xanthosine phosphorylase family protein
VRDLLLTNAAGGTRPEWELPALMRITDHVNHQGQAPLRREEASCGRVYDETLGEALDLAAAERGITLHQGVYHAVLGPSYETPAEVRMMADAGAGAIGMSTVQEAMVARAAGMRVAAVSAITNPGAGISETPLSHDEVVEAGQVLSERFCDLVEAFVARV